jgi:hypothetical protein
MTEPEEAPFKLTLPFERYEETKIADANGHVLSCDYPEVAEVVMAMLNASQDMLAALKRAVASADENRKDYAYRKPECQADYDACVAAIAKAEGK